MASGLGLREAMCPPTQSESMPEASRRGDVRGVAAADEANLDRDRVGGHARASEIWARSPADNPRMVVSTWSLS